MSIKDLINNPGPSSWYEPLWFTTVEDNLGYLLNINNVEAVKIDPIMHEHHKHNFYNFLREQVTPERRYWYVIMRVNGMTSPTQFSENMDFMVYPKLQLIDQLHEQYLSSTRR